MKEKSAEEILISIAKVLDSLKIPYYITGGFAVSIWGKPRFTADIDLIIKMAHPQKQEFAKKLQKIFPDGYLDLEQINTALARNGEFNFIDPSSGMKVDFWISKNDLFDNECFKNAKTVDLNYKLKFISPENLILSKLIWYKETNSTRHIEDAQTVINNTLKLDQKYLKNWVLKLQLSNQFEKLN